MSELVYSGKQQAVFENIAHGIGHTVLRARAGCAKTTTIVEGVKHVPRAPRYLSTCFVAFNKSIANTLKEKIRGGEVSTFHSYGFKGCNRAFDDLELDTERVDKLCKNRVWGRDWKYRRVVSKVVSLAKGVLAETPSQLDELVDNFGIDLPPAVLGEENGRLRFTERAAEILETCKDVQGTIDFDDMVWLPIVHDLRTFQYDRVFVDELQDMNPAQLKLALKMTVPGGRVMAVGDDRQAIYAWRGAQNEAVDWLVQHLDASVLPLTICYRCDRAIVELAQEIVPDIEPCDWAGPGSIDETGFAAMIERAGPGDFVLSRSNAPLVTACLRLLAADKRARIQGRDIGSSLAAFVKGANSPSVIYFRKYVDEWRVQEIARLAKCDPPRSPQNVNDKADTLLTLSEGMSTMDDILRRLDRLFSDEGPGQIICSTIHKAKGLEADRVWVLGASFEGCHGWVEKRLREASSAGAGGTALTQAAARVREENNILYVGITRARHELVFVDGCPSALAESLL